MPAFIIYVPIHLFLFLILIIQCKFNYIISRCTMQQSDRWIRLPKALWLHDWLLQQLDYDNSLEYSSAEVLYTGTGTCQAYEVLIHDY